MTLKSWMREKLKGMRKSLTEEEVRERSRRIRELLFGIPEFSSASVVSFYVSKPGSGEVSTLEMIEEALKAGKRMLVPYVEAGRIFLAEISDPGRQLSPGTFGIPEPPRELRRPAPLRDVDLVVVPGLAFDLRGNRLGHGFGYYDGLLREISSANPAARFAGLAYDFQVLDEIPSSPHDVPVHLVVTETRVIRARCG